MQTTKQEKKIIMKFITHYDSLNDRNKVLTRDAFLKESGLSQNTFYYKLKKQNYKRKEIEILAELLNPSKTIKDVSTEML